MEENDEKFVNLCFVISLQRAAYDIPFYIVGSCGDVRSTNSVVACVSVVN
jgi:hypothetical protein